MPPTDKKFPFWPPSSPQRPAIIAGRQAMTVIQDLAVNQVPNGRNDEIKFIPRPVPRVRKPELPASPEIRSEGMVSRSLYDLYMLTEQMPADQLFRALSNGGQA